MNLSQRWIGVGLALGLAALAPRLAGAQVEAAAVARIALLNNKAMDDYDSLEFDAAKKSLLEALSVARGAGITGGKELVDTYLNLGVVVGAGLNDRAAAVKYFTAALRIDGTAVLNPTRATPGLEQMFEEARAAASQAAAPPSDAFRHDPVDMARAGRPIRMRARVSPMLAPDRVVLFYKSTGTRAFAESPMVSRRRGHYAAAIPGGKVRGRSIYYYIEAQDEDGERLAGSGTATSPNIISVKGRTRRRRRKPPEPEPGKSVISIALMVGTGLGVVNGGESEHVQPRVGGAPEQVDINPGGSLTPLHIAPEVTYHLSETWQIGVIGRIQVPVAVPEKEVSILGEARAKRLFGEGPLRFYLAFGAGGGQIRHRIPLGDYDGKPGTPDNLVDSRVAGVVAFGLGGGVTYTFTENVGVIAELNGLIVVPDFAAHVDVNVGPLLSF